MFLKDTNVGRLILEQVQIEKTAAKKDTSQVCIADAKQISEGLSKVAGLPYKEETYHSLQQMIKLASENMTQLVDVLESVQERNSELEKAAEVRILIEDMVKVGQLDEYNIEDAVTELMSKDDRERSIIKEAFKMSQSQNGTEGNRFFELEKDANLSDGRRGMFDGVLD